MIIFSIFSNFVHAADSPECPGLNTALKMMEPIGNGQVVYKGHTFEFKDYMRQYAKQFAYVYNPKIYDPDDPKTEKIFDTPPPLDDKQCRYLLLSGTDYGIRIAFEPGCRCGFLTNDIILKMKD